MKNKEVWKFVIQTTISILSAIATALGVTRRDKLHVNSIFFNFASLLHKIYIFMQYNV